MSTPASEPAAPLRVAFVAPYPAAALLPGDAVKPKYATEHPATWVRTLGEALVRLPGIALRVIADSRAVTRIHHAEQHGVHYTFVPKREPIRTDPLHGYRPGARRVRKALRDFQPDIVIGFGIENGCGGIATRLPWPGIVFIQGIIEKTADLRDIHPLRLAAYLRDERRVVHRAHALVAETAFAREWAAGINPRALIRVIPHAMDTEYLSNEPTFIEPVVLCVGSLHPVKDPATVLRAFAACGQPDARLVLAGDGPLRGDLEREAAALGVAARVTFAGHVPRETLLGFMRAARCVVLGSRMDTSPNVLTEAHAAGLPVIATRTGGIPDMVDEGVDGLLAEVGDVQAIAAHMGRLLRDAALARALGAAGRRKVLTLNDPGEVARQHLDFYRAVIDHHNMERLRRRTQRRPVTQAKTLRRVACVLPVGSRLGTGYPMWRRKLRLKQFWPRERIDAWQLDRLREMVDFAIRHTEGYRELYRKAGITARDLRTTADIVNLPFVTKELLRDNLDAFSTTRAGRRYVTTGGSTGIPLGFYSSRRLRAVEMAFMHAGWEWAGWKLGMPSAILRGGYIGSPEHPTDYDPYFRELRLSSYFLSHTTLPVYLQAIAERRIDVLQAYPSSFNMLCDLLRESGQRLPLKLVLLGSENVYDWQLEKFRAAMPGTRFFAWYGQAEQVILAPWCEHTTRYHSRPFYGLTEVVDAAGRPVGKGVEGELVGTNFHNFHTPFIRYRTMDYAVHGGVGCPDCGRPFLLLDRITGRAQEFILTGRGRYISMTAINMHDAIFDGIRQFRFRQEEAGRVTFLYIPAAPLGRDALARIMHGLQAKLGDDVALALQETTELPRTPSGKFRFLDQQLNLRYGDRA
ncbi:MAG TPA: glycosyltransferase [Kiritimatiellia bacterium]|nr:glycosyltransferase [Kiritimatiellia bacterium]